MTAPKQAFASKPFVAVAPRFVDKTEADSLHQAIQERIAQRAYRLYESSGYQSGNEQNNWLQAEAEVVQRTLTVRESGSWVALSGDLPQVSAENVQIYVDPRRIVVRAKKQDVGPAAEPAEAEPTESFLVADLHVDVEPATATAALKDEKLSLMVKKCFPGSVAPIEFAGH